MSWKYVQRNSETGAYRTHSGGGGGASSAEDVSYDNTTSGLTAENVQDALDEMQGNLTASVSGSNVPFQFIYDSNTQKYGYKDGADTFHPFSSGASIPTLEKVYDNTSDPIEYTYTVQTAGQYMLIYIKGDGGSTFTTTGTIVTELVQGGRQLSYHVVDCEVGDTIYIKNSNYSGGAYRGATVSIVKINGMRITAFTESYYAKYNDTSLSKTSTLSSNTKYMIVGMTQGSSRNAQWYFTTCKNAIVSIAEYNNVYHILFVDSGDGGDIYQYLYGQAAGAIIFAGYVLTTD